MESLSVQFTVGPTEKCGESMQTVGIFTMRNTMCLFSGF